MSRQHVTIRRIDPWSMLKFGFVVNLVLLGIELLLAMVLWAFVRRLELIERICDLATSIGFRECGVDGGALFDTVLVLGLLGVVIQTGIIVFLTFLANLIFDLTGGIQVTLEDGGPAATPTTGRLGQTLSAGRAARRSRGGRGDASESGARGTGSGAASAGTGTDTTTTSAAAAPSSGGGASTTQTSRPWPGDQMGSQTAPSATSTADDGGDDLFGGR